VPDPVGKDTRQRAKPAWRLFVPLTVVLIVAACASPGISASIVPLASASASPSAAPHLACGAAPVIAVEAPVRRSFVIGGLQRVYTLSLPSSYSGLEPAPVVVNLHGLGGSGRELASVSGLEPDAWGRGYVMVYPNAVGGVWNTTDATDVDFIVALLDQVATEVCIDPGRIFAVGLSQGGEFASFLACSQPGRFAAVASVAMLNYFERCSTWKAMPLLAFAGTNDPLYRPESGLTLNIDYPGEEVDRPGPLAMEAASWADANGCDLTPTQTPGPAGTARFIFMCPEGADVSYVLHDGGHGWPGGTPPYPGNGPAVPDLDANSIILDFFEALAGS
jgi:polyhydroxybutyrate depolymerase